MRVSYGSGVVIDLPLITAGAQGFKTSPTIAAGDAKFYSDQLISTTLTSKTRAFTSGGTYEVKKGDTITGATSTATAVVIGVRLTSGTWAGGDAAGILFVEQDSGTFQSENLDVGANTDVATIGGALSAAGIFNEVALGVVAVGVPSAMLQCRKGMLILHDAAGAEWEDTAESFETEDHPSAFDTKGCLLQDTALSTGQTTTNIRLGADPATTLGVASFALKTGYFFVVSSGTGSGQAGYIKTYTAGATFDVVPYVALDTVLDDTSVVKYYLDAKGVPAHLVALEAAVITDAAFTPAVTPAALPSLGTSGPLALLNYLAARLGLAKRTFNKSTGVETQRNVVDNATLGTATHTDDGTTVTKSKLA